MAMPALDKRGPVLRGVYVNEGIRKVRPSLRRQAMPAKTEKQRKFMGAELARKRAGKKTKTGMSEKELEKMASKKKS
jgi:hypothetical protein